MYISDWVTTTRLDGRASAIAGVVSNLAARLAIDQTDEGISAETVKSLVRAYRILDSVPVLFMEKSEIANHPASIHTVPDRGVEAIVIIVDEQDPYLAVRRVWITDATLVPRYRGAKDRFMFRLQRVVEGGDVFAR